MPDTTGPDECLKYAQYIIDNYAQPKLRLAQITIRPVHPDDPRAAAIWDVLCNVDISDQVNVDMNHPGLGGVTQSFFVEGITRTLGTARARPRHRLPERRDDPRPVTRVVLGDPAGRP